MKLKIFILVLLPVFFIHQVYAQQWKWEYAETGKFVAGYKTIILKTFARPFSVSPLSPRILPLHIWYPAQSATQQNLRFADFVINELKPLHNTQSSETILLNLVKQYIDSTEAVVTAKQIGQVITSSCPNAPVVKGKFPVVLMGNGLTTPGFFYTLMAEYLASHGYVVISYPSLPENETATVGFNERGILNQVADMEWVINEIAKLPFADKDNIVLAAWSVGGASQILFQMKHKMAKALISMDAASQYQYGKELITSSIYYDSAAFTTPFLNLTAAGPARFVVPRSNYFADTMAVNRQQFIFPKLSHSNFLSFHQYILWLTKPDAAIKKSYEEMCEMMSLYYKII